MGSSRFHEYGSHNLRMTPQEEQHHANRERCMHHFGGKPGESNHRAQAHPNQRETKSLCSEASGGKPRSGRLHRLQRGHLAVRDRDLYILCDYRKHRFEFVFSKRERIVIYLNT